MHNAAFRALDLDAVYLAFDVTPADFPAAIAGARALGLRQLAISLPHKEAALALVDEVDETARAIGAINTITRRGDRLVGANTDWIGALRALERATPVAGKRAVVLGAGGSARAVIFGLLRSGAQVTVLNRSTERAAAVARELGASFGGGLDRLRELDCDLLVNTTSVGLRADASPVDASALRRGAVVLDAVYDPPRTRLLTDAEARGATAIGGKWMLVYQAAAQFELWSGMSAPIDAMADAFDRAGAT
jgi:shikimate dehydrogenase